jgi:chaperone required for assembly of F1-ATPase
MRELFENISPEDPMKSARRSVRPAQRRRFYDKATVAAGAEPGTSALLLDGKPVRTPARRVLALPSAELAEAVAAEWNAQTNLIAPVRMPLTRLANAIIDGVADRPGPVVAEVAKYLASDLLFYRASGPTELVARQARHWDPVLAWAREILQVDFRTVEGVVHVAQPDAALGAARKAIPSDPWRLGAVHAATTLTGSALLALALLRGRLSVDETWRAAHVDEDWNVDQWGRDELESERVAFRFAEFQAAGTVLRHVVVNETGNTGHGFS